MAAVLDLGGLKLSAATAATKTFAILAKRRAGKTYTGSVMAEEFVQAGIPFYVLDPTGAWWGLRSSPSGKRAGLPVIVIGGEHGDVPLEPTAAAGRVLADLVVGDLSHYVIDLSLVETNAELVRFATAFLGRVHQRKAKDRRPLHGFWDEADLFAPQRPDKDETKMLHHAEQIVRRGGIRGEGTTLITQRAAVLNKNVLTQIDVLILLRLIGSQDIGAVEDYVKYSGESTERRRDLLESLPSLAIGEAQVYGPGEDPPLFDRVRIRERRTFNSSATPEEGTPIEARKLADVDVDRLRAAMADTIERAAAEDPEQLRRRIAELERALAEQPARPPERVDVPVIADDAIAALDRAASAAAGVLEEFGIVADELRTAAAEIEGMVGQLRAHDTRVDVDPRVLEAERRRDERPAAPPRSNAAGPPAQSNGDGPQLGKAARALLSTLIAHRPRRLSRAELSTLSGYKPRSSTYRNALSALRTNGLLDENGDTFTASDAGVQLLGDAAPPAPQTTEQLLETWYAVLGAASRAMLQQLVDVYPGGLTREEIAERTGYSLTSSTFRNALSALRVNGLLDETGAGIGAASSVFIGGRV